MKNWLNNYFGFTKREFNGLLVLMALLLVVSIVPYFYAFYVAKTTPLTTAEQLAVQQLVWVNENQQSNFVAVRKQIEESEMGSHTTLFKFDPNQINLAQWQQLGLSVKQAQAIINYRNKGGKFYKATDLKKMYTISPKKYEQLAAYIEIDAVAKNPKYAQDAYVPKTTYIKKERIIIEINGADTLQLDLINGIGAAFARRITKYRDRLGGFHKKEQLMEVYGLDSTKFSEIKDQISLNTASVKKININTATFDQLKNHPYLNYKQINAIINYRTQHGKYNDASDLKKVIILTPQTIQNIIPYLNFNDPNQN